MRLQAGDTIANYEIVAPIGQGGMATVYRAYHEHLDRMVAVKFMHETFLQDEDFRARFQREARIVARLEHPAIVPIYDYKEHEGVPYLVMKYVNGMTLKKRLIKTGLSLAETSDFLTKIASGLDYAHKQGILHRDMKPSNILIDQDSQPYITDFGLARIANAGASTISHDMLLGTPYYISPEQAQGSRDIDHRADIYSLAVILYEAITGRLPFEADTPYAIVHGHIYHKADPPSQYNEALSPAIDAVVLRGMSKDRDERYHSASEMLSAFRAALAEQVPDDPTIILQRPTFHENSRYDDIVDQKPKTNSNKQPAPEQQRQIQAQVDLQLDMGEWRDMGNRIRSGVHSLAEMIEERIDSELRDRRGIALTEEEIVRRQVLSRHKARKEFVGNLASYIMVNTALFFIWMFTGGGFPWIIFPLFFWGIGVVGQGYEYYSKYGAGAERQRNNIENEIERELAERSTYSEKLKYEPAEATGRTQRLSLDEVTSRGNGVRLNDEGELTDSFVQEQFRRS